jgi:hypothetical protein
MEGIETKQNFMRFEVLTAVTMTIIVFWDVTLCNLSDVQSFRGTCCLHLGEEELNSTLKKEAARSSKKNPKHLPDYTMYQKTVIFKQELDKRFYEEVSAKDSPNTISSGGQRGHRYDKCVYLTRCPLLYLYLCMYYYNMSHVIAIHLFILSLSKYLLTL